MSAAVEVEITDETVLSTLREVIAEKPEYVYSAPEYMGRDSEGGRCFYVHEDEGGDAVACGCVVGHVLHRLGVPLSWMARYEGKPSTSLTYRAFQGLTTRTHNVLNNAQIAQDNGDAWGVAYAKATGETI